MSMASVPGAQSRLAPRGTALTRGNDNPSRVAGQATVHRDELETGLAAPGLAARTCPRHARGYSGLLKQSRQGSWQVGPPGLDDAAHQPVVDRSVAVDQDVAKRHDARQRRDALRRLRAHVEGLTQRLADHLERPLRCRAREVVMLVVVDVFARNEPLDADGCLASASLQLRCISVHKLTVAEPRRACGNGGSPSWPRRPDPWAC